MLDESLYEVLPRVCRIVKLELPVQRIVHTHEVPRRADSEFLHQSFNVGATQWILHNVDDYGIQLAAFEYADGSVR